MIKRDMSSGDRCLHAWLRRKLPGKEKTEGPFKGLVWSHREHYTEYQHGKKKKKIHDNWKDSDSQSQ